MSDRVTIQEFLFYGMKSCALFDAFNIVMWRQFLMQSEIEMSAIWQAPRSVPDGPNGPDVTTPRLSGCGLIVEIPRMEAPNPNSLQRNLIASIGIIEERNLNMAPQVVGPEGFVTGGTQVSAEDAGELAHDFLFNWGMGFSSGLAPVKGAVVEAPDLVEGPGLITQRAIVSLRWERRPLARCEVPVLGNPAPGFYSLSTATDGAVVYYTTDASFPGSANAVTAGGSAKLFDGTAIALESGSVLTAAAWRLDLNPSHVKNFAI